MSDKPLPTGALQLFYSYAHEDEGLRSELEKRLVMLKRENVICGWHDRHIVPGDEWDHAINHYLKSADIILLLVSADFLASDYCFDVELKEAMKMHEAGAARVVPVILRPCDWKGAPFGKLQALPTDGTPVTKWPDRDEAFANVVEGIRSVTEALRGARRDARLTRKPPGGAPHIPRSPVFGFVARRDEGGRDIVELLKEELAPESNRLVALWGPGGSGKSTLAAEFVRAGGDVFEGRVAWVSAHGRSDFGLATLLDETAARLGREDLRRLAPEAKAAQVGALVSEAPTLVVLDNLETVSAEEQSLCLDFLAQRAACPALITTRAFVNRDEVYNVALAAMSMDEARDLLRRLVGHTRPQTRAHFDRLDRDELIRRCEGNPLVLQWVVKQIDVAKQRPQDVLDDLAQGEGDAAERVFTRSFNLPQLGDDGRAALLALAIFRPEAAREALAEVAGFGTDLRRLNKAVENLSALWLVETTEGNERLFLRGLTRGLAGARLSHDEGAGDYLSRYVGYFLPYAEAHKEPTQAGLEALEVEKANLLAATNIAFTFEAWGIVMQLYNALYRFLVLRGHWDEALKSGRQAMDAARAEGNEWNAHLFSGNMAMIRRNRGEYEAAASAYRESLEFFRKNGSEKNVLACLHQLGVIAHDKGEPEEARRFYEESMELGKKIGSQGSVADGLHQLGRLAYDKGRWEEARGLYGESLTLYESLGDEGATAGTLTNLALVVQEQGDWEESRRLTQQALEIHKRLGDQYSVALTLNNLGLIEEKESRNAEAAGHFRESLRILETLGSPIAAKARNNLERVTGEPVQPDEKG